MNAKKIIGGLALVALILAAMFVINERKPGEPPTKSEGSRTEEQAPLSDDIAASSETIISELLQESEGQLPEEDFGFLEEDNAAYEDDAFSEF